MCFDWLDFLFPVQSLRGSEGEWCTAGELAAIPVQPGHASSYTLQQAGLQYLDELWWATPYNRSSLLATALHSLKYRRRPQLAAILCRHLVAGLPLVLPDAELVPVPLHWFRRFQRGFNQAELIAAELARVNDISLQHVLRRRRSTGHQARRRRRERLIAVADAFCIASSVPRRVILVDDVATTGATLDACAKTLKSAGTAYVGAYVLARG